MTAKEIFERAIKDLQEGRIAEAEHGLNWLLDRKPDNPDLLFYLGTCLMKRGFFALPEMLLKKALEINPNGVSAWNNLGALLKDDNRIEEAEAAFRKALELYGDGDPKELSTMYSNLATLYVNAGNPQKALEYSDKAVELDAENQQARWNRGLAHLEMGLWKEGWEGYECGFVGSKRKDKTYPIDLPVWDGTEGKNVIVYGEQGLGDEIMFASMIGELSKRANIVYDAHPRLADIMRTSFPEIPVYGTRKTDEMPWFKFHTYDAKISIGSLGKFFRNKAEDFPKTPYLKADPVLSKKYKKKLSQCKKPKIGISWKGGYKKTRKDLRSVTLEQLAPIFKFDADFFSLQYTPTAKEEVDAFCDSAGMAIHHWQPEIDNYDLTAALVDNLDLVISVCTSIVHLSGAMGKECWCLTPSQPAWRYGIAGDMPWYDSVKLFRQEGEDWETTINKVYEGLCLRFQTAIAV